VRVLRPFKNRDFAILWTGLTVSLLGDGIYFVAIAWQVYQLSNDPTALSLVGVAWTVPHVSLLLVGGAVGDRFERRRVMLLANVVSGAAIGAIAALSLAGAIELWHIWLLVAVHGAAVAFFVPAAGAIIPEIVPPELLVEANSLRQFIRPLTLRLLGPALGGGLIAAVGTGEAFLLDSLSFGFAAATLAFLRPRPPAAPEASGGPESPSILREMADGIRFVRSQSWLWLSLVAAGLWLLLTVGPIEVLIPFLVKNSLHGGADSLGLVFAAGGAGAIVSSLLVAHKKLPRHALAFVYLTWSAATFAVAALALSVALWQAMLAACFQFAASNAGAIAWATLLQKRVPGELLGRVTSLDWIASAGLVPLSFALTGPVAAAIGAKTTLFAAGAAGGALMLSFLLFPALRAPERAEPVATAFGRVSSEDETRPAAPGV
jgi:MFS family permease